MLSIALPPSLLSASSNSATGAGDGPPDAPQCLGCSSSSGHLPSAHLRRLKSEAARVSVLNWRDVALSQMAVCLVGKAGVEDETLVGYSWLMLWQEKGEKNAGRCGFH